MVTGCLVQPHNVYLQVNAPQFIIGFDHYNDQERLLALPVQHERVPSLLLESISLAPNDPEFIKTNEQVFLFCSAPEFEVVPESCEFTPAVSSLNLPMIQHAVLRNIDLRTNVKSPVLDLKQRFQLTIPTKLAHHPGFEHIPSQSYTPRQADQNKLIHECHPHNTDKYQQLLKAPTKELDNQAKQQRNQLSQKRVAAFKASGADYIIAIGGGSSMDTAKAIGIIIANPEFEDVRSLEGTAPTKKPCVPIIAVPTTAGTAAEVTINYVITDVERKRKFVCVDPHDMPIVAIVDPDMMASMPKGLTASTGMDALTHAIEGYTTKGAWEMTDMFHLKAIEIISRSLRGAVANTREGREGMALGQYIAGMGFSNVGLGIAHSMAHTLGAVYDTPHGVACAMMLPIVMEYNADCTGEKYREIARAMGVKGVDDMDQETYRKAAVDAVRKLSEDVGIPSRLEALKEEDLQFLAESAYADACAPGNPKDASVDDLTTLFRKLM